MHYPKIAKPSISNLSKICFSSIASAVLMEILKRQRDAVGLSIYSKFIEFYTPEKGNDAHRRLLLKKLEDLLSASPQKHTETYTVLHQIAEKLHRRSLIFLFTDMLQVEKNEEELFDALRHLKYNKHEVVLFHTYDGKLELNFDFDNRPKKFVDVETGAQINLYADSIKEGYQTEMKTYFKKLKTKCEN